MISSLSKNWMSWVKDPVRLNSPGDIQWDDEADVVVVGYGGAGVCAALEARDLHADVLIVERFDPGGATKLSGGVYYGGGTKVQQELGVKDSAADMYRYLKRQTEDVVSDATLRSFCDESGPNLDWLMRHGVKFGGDVYSGKASYPGGGFHLYYSGNEVLRPYREEAAPAPRGHRTVHPDNIDGLTGSYYFGALERAAAKAGVRVLTHAPVQRLITNSNGDVIGVEANILPAETGARDRHAAIRNRFVPLDPRHTKSRRRIQSLLEEIEQQEGKPRRIRAKNGVILAAGGFIHNWDMLSSVAKVDHRRTVRMGAPGCDGAGIRLGQSVGGDVGLMSNCDHGRALRPDLYARGALVNTKGERFINEMAYAGTLGEIVIEGGHKKIWIIINKRMRDEALKIAFRARVNFYFVGLPIILGLLVGKKARTIGELARKLNAPAERLVATIEAYNRAARGAEPDVFGKDSDRMEVLDRGPYYAVEQSIDATFAPMIAFTTGGLVVDEATGLVKRNDGSLIEGLYAAGRTAIGLCSKSYVSGMSIADCVFSGRRAGRNCVTRDAHVGAS